MLNVVLIRKDLRCPFLAYAFHRQLIEIAAIFLFWIEQAGRHLLLTFFYKLFHLPFINLCLLLRIRMVAAAFILRLVVHFVLIVSFRMLQSQLAVPLVQKQRGVVSFQFLLLMLRLVLVFFLLLYFCSYKGDRLFVWVHDARVLEFYLIEEYFFRFTINRFKLREMATKAHIPDAPTANQFTATFTLFYRRPRHTLAYLTLENAQ